MEKSGKNSKTFKKTWKNSKTFKKQGKYGKVREKFENVKKKQGKRKSQGKI